MSDGHPTGGFDDLALPLLRLRRSVKWTQYEPDVLPVWIAEMDFDVARPIHEVLLEAVSRSDLGYPSTEPLAAAFAHFARARWSWQVEVGHVHAVSDVVTGIAEVLLAMTEPGDGVVINPPVYAPFFSTIESVGRRVVSVPLVSVAGRPTVDLGRLDAAFAAGARAYLLCNPHNPTGTVLSRTELEAIADLAARYGVAVIADEIHGPLTHPDTEFTSFASLGQERCKRVVSLLSASKAWNLAGMKCAVIVAGSPSAEAELQRLPESLRYHVGHFGVLASIAAFTEGGLWLDECVRHIAANRVLLSELVTEKLPGVGYREPEAGYLAWLDFRTTTLGDDPADVLHTVGRVALSPGPPMGDEGIGFARLNFGTSPAILTEAVERIAATLAAH